MSVKLSNLFRSLQTSNSEKGILILVVENGYGIKYNIFSEIKIIML